MRQRFLRWLILPLSCLFLLLGACDREEEKPPAAGEERLEDTIRKEQTAADATRGEGQAETQVETAVARLEPTEGNEARGTVTFTSENGALRIVAEVEGLEPGKHGFHVHEKGDCSAPDASSAGGHYNPAGTPHGAPNDPSEQRHVGDMGNLEADEEGRANYDRLDQMISLSGENSIVGKAVVIHAEADDLESQPSGDAGPRIACGVIEASE